MACCPPNVMRLVASLGDYLASCDRTGLQVHQYAPARLATSLPSGPDVALRMETRYPWEGLVRLTVEAGDGGSWTLALRVPAWCGRAAARVNGSAVDAFPDATGYLNVSSGAGGPATWSKADFPMVTTLLEPHPAIESTRGCLAIERGPLVYCLEQADQGDTPLAEVEIDAAGPLTPRWEPDLLEGIVAIRAAGAQVDTTSWGGQLYRPVGSGASAATAAGRPDGDPRPRLGQSSRGGDARLDPAGYNLSAIASRGRPRHHLTGRRTACQERTGCGSDSCSRSATRNRTLEPPDPPITGTGTRVSTGSPASIHARLSAG